MVVYLVSDLCFDYFQLLISDSNVTFRFFFLLYIVYLVRVGNKYKFEIIFKHVFCCLNSFLYIEFPHMSLMGDMPELPPLPNRKLRKWEKEMFLKILHIRKFRRSEDWMRFSYSLQEFLGYIFIKMLVDFKLVLFDINKRRTRKKCYKAIGFEDLISTHSDLYTQAKSIKAFLQELRDSLRARQRLRSPRKRGAFRAARLELKKELLDPKTKKPLIPLLQPIILYPVCVTFEYKRLKSFVFLFKGARLQDHKCIYIRLVREFILSFFEVSVSFYVVQELYEITTSHQYDVKF